MVRFLMIFLTFLLITASAALIGLEIPVYDSVVIPQKVPIEKEDASILEPPEEISKSSDEVPRFIPDEPLELDPSAAEKLDSDPHSDTEPKVPTEHEIKKAAEPHIREIISIKENAFANLASLEKKIAIDYLSLPKEEREDAPSILAEKYIPRASLLLSGTDRDVERVLKKLESSLSAINAPLTIVEEARKSYEEEKEETLNSYRELLKSLGQDIDIEKLLNE